MMDLKKLKEAVNTLEKFRKCGYTDCLCECAECSYNYDTADLNNSVDVAITVMNDVIKNMEKLINRQS
jgi:hypothetical protein